MGFGRRLPDTYFTEEIVASYLPKRELLCEALRAVGFTLSVPEGAYYIFTQVIPPAPSLFTPEPNQGSPGRSSGTAACSAHPSGSRSLTTVSCAILRGVSTAAAAIYQRACW